MSFHMMDLKEKHFLDLIDDNLKPIDSMYIKNGPWINYLGLFNFLYTRVTRAITNYAPIDEYCIRFFPNKDFSCLYRMYLIESRQHILHEYRRFNNY